MTPETSLSKSTTSDSSLSKSTTSDSSFHPVKNSRKKVKSHPKVKVNFYICEKTEMAAKTKVKLGINYMEKFLGGNVATAPVLLGKTPKRHFVFLTKIKAAKAKEFLQYIQDGYLNSWNVVGVTVGDLKKCERSISPNNARHDNCNYPGHGPF